MPGTGASGGRNAVSRRTLAARGTKRKDRHDDFETPEPSKGRPEPPFALTKEALEEWDRMLGRLDDCGSLAKVDDMAVYQYCRLVMETEGLLDRQERVENSLQILEGSLGDVEADDKISLLREIGKMTQLAAGFDNKIRQGRMAVRQYLVEFGLTPAARSRVKLPSKKQDTEDTDMFGGPRGVVGRTG